MDEKLLTKYLDKFIHGSASLKNVESPSVLAMAMLGYMRGFIKDIYLQGDEDGYNRGYKEGKEAWIDEKRN